MLSLTFAYMHRNSLFLAHCHACSVHYIKSQSVTVYTLYVHVDGQDALCDDGPPKQENELTFFSAAGQHREITYLRVNNPSVDGLVSCPH